MNVKRAARLPREILKTEDQSDWLKAETTIMYVLVDVAAITPTASPALLSYKSMICCNLTRTQGRVMADAEPNKARTAIMNSRSIHLTNHLTCHPGEGCTADATAAAVTYDHRTVFNAPSQGAP
ncbi:hypothetical protein Bbelb_225520 [Branchiostoma belcheri]|nr:hypothetical protein Bbelb_225520 [Branchiostoma belcheri]